MRARTPKAIVPLDPSSLDIVHGGGIWDWIPPIFPQPQPQPIPIPVGGGRPRPRPYPPR